MVQRFFSYGLCVSAVALNQYLSICSKTEKVLGTNCFTPLEKYKITTFGREIPHTLIFYTKTSIRDTSKNKRLIVRMMNELNIDNQTAASSCSIPSMTSTNQSSHSQQKQQRDRARFFYLQRQKRKQRRLQQGPLHIQLYQQRVTTPIQTSREKKFVTGIVGSSIARDISVRNIENSNNEVKLRYKSGSDCAEALSWLRSNEGRMFMNNVDQLIFILGTNDLHRTEAIETVQRIGQTVELIRHFYPGVNIVWQLLQQRTRKTWVLPEGPLVMNEINRCNRLLLESAAAKHFDTIQPGIPIECMYDGLHPSMHGVRLMESTIRNYLEERRMRYPFFSFNIPSLMSIQF